MFSRTPSFQPSVCPQPNFKSFAVCSISPAKSYYMSLANKYHCLTPDDPSWKLTPITGRAAYDIGNKYYYGKGFPVDYRTAIAWYLQAGDYADAQVALGYMYDQGLGAAIDYKKAREFYEKAAAKDDGQAMFNLGVLDQQGQGGPVDFGKARFWYEKALRRAKQTRNAEIERGVRINMNNMSPTRTTSGGSGTSTWSSSSSDDEYNRERQQNDLQTEMIQQDHQQQEPQ